MKPRETPEQKAARLHREALDRAASKAPVDATRTWRFVEYPDGSRREVFFWPAQTPQEAEAHFPGCALRHHPEG